MSNRSQKPPVERLKGLDSLFGEEPSKEQSVPLSCIKLPLRQPRRYFDPQKMEQLVQSVREHGILEPLLVRLTSLPNTYELVAGERRYRAASTAGLLSVPVIVRELSEEEAWLIALIENLQREDLNPIEETEGILQLLAFKLKRPLAEVPLVLYRMQNERPKEKSNGNVTINSEIADTVQEVFTGLGLMTWESFIRNRLPLINLPEDILDSLRQGQIAYTKATALAVVKDSQVRQSLLDLAISQNLSLTQIRERIKALHPPVKTPQSLKSRLQEAYRRSQKAKFWNDPVKQKKLEKVITQLEALLAEEV